MHLFVYVGAFFFSALVCHLKLAETRPEPSHLTEFYLLLSLGGVVGGMFNAFLAPAIFSGVAEFPLVLAASVLARPWQSARLTAFMTGVAVLGVGAALALALIPKTPTRSTSQSRWRWQALPRRASSAAARCSSRSSSAPSVWRPCCVPPDKHATLSASRSFFGVYRVTAGNRCRLGRIHLMFHGTTVHGAEPLTPEERCGATTYYATATPLGQVLAAVLSRPGAQSVGVVGLGVGTVAAYTRPGDLMRFFEIDPEVERIARDRSQFRYLSDCARGDVDVVLGDARLTLAREPRGRYDLLHARCLLRRHSADASSHRRSAALYLGLLKPDGLLVLHLSNRNLALEAPAAAGAKKSAPPR